jgi:hypothetical protein
VPKPIPKRIDSRIAKSILGFGIVGHKIGIAIKIEDGASNRALLPIIVKSLENIGFNININPTLSFSPIENFSMNINNFSEKPRFFIVITNFCFKMPQISSFGSLITWNGKDLEDTILIRSNTSEVGIRYLTEIMLFPGNN